MSVPVYEEERLGSFSASDPYPLCKYPLGAPDEPSTCQGLYLDTDGDVLLGRANNGAPVSPPSCSLSSPHPDDDSPDSCTCQV
jgi:hypothetical protein